MQLEGQRALISGGSRGIGAEICRFLVREGADIAFTHWEDRQEAARLVREISTLGPRVLSFESDVSDFEQAGEVVTQVLEHFSSIDILVNNAGITRDRVCWKMEEREWDRVLEVNLKGCFNYIHHVLPQMRRQGRGRIVNITSINGLRGKFGQSNYAASKAGIIGLTKSVAREVGAQGITVNAVAPGLIETDLLKDSPESAQIRKAALSEIVLGRLGQPRDVAAAVLFLVTDQSRHITGQVLQVDGGQYL